MLTDVGPCGVVGDALASSKRSGKSTGLLLASYAAAYALRHTRHADRPLVLPRKIGATRLFISVSSLSLGVARLSGLWLALASLALFEPIAVAVQFEDVDVVGQSVEQRTGQPLGPEHTIIPALA